ncbi:MAG: YgeY family selenium metabolism-linked hydrolase [Anaerolineae bacterium]|nr:YgeY family selenium metabolism-linked hydrolase [Anaerolineae bacterium]
MRFFPLFPSFGFDLVLASHSAPVLDSNEQSEMFSFLKELVQTPSFSAQEQDVAKLIIKHLRSNGIKNVHLDPAGNVIARIGNGNGPTLLYDAHMDTVYPSGGGWSYEAHAVAEEDGVLYGLGACDMKGSIAAFVYAAKQLIQDKTALHGNLILVFVVQEEPCEGYALKYILEEQGIQPDWVVLGEPSNLNIMRGHRGRVLFKVTVQGKSSHAASPELGDNAITAAARLIFGIELLAAELPTDPSLGPGTIAVTEIESRSASIHAVPHTCGFYIDRRLTLGETITRAQAQIESVIRREGIDATVEIVNHQITTYTGHEFSVHEAFRAWSVEENHPLIQTIEAVIRSAIGHSPKVGHWPFSTDGVYSMGEAEIPTIGFGPGDPRCAHTADEHIRLDDVVKATQVYASLAATLLSKSSD